MPKAKLAEWLLRQSQADGQIVKGNILNQVNSIAYQARMGPSRITTTNGKTGKTFRLPSNLVNASIESFAKGAPGATMLPGVRDRTIDHGLALVLRPLVHPPRPELITRDLVKIVYWNLVVAWLEIRSPLFRRYLAYGKKTSGNKGYIALVRGVFASLDLLVGSPLSSDAVGERTGQPEFMIDYLYGKATTFPDVVKGAYIVQMLCLPYTEVKGQSKEFPSITPLSDTFRLLGLSTEDEAPPVPLIQSSNQVGHKRTQGTKLLKTGPVYTKGKYGQKIDDDLNYGAWTFVGRPCQMSLFDPAAVPELLVEAIHPLVNRRNVVAAEDYEPDLLIFIDCWVQSQNEDLKSYLNAPDEAKPPTWIVTSRRAMSDIYDIFGDPPTSKGDSIALFALRPTARWLYDLHQTRPRLVLPEYAHQFPEQVMTHPSDEEQIQKDESAAQDKNPHAESLEIEAEEDTLLLEGPYGITVMDNQVEDVEDIWDKLAFAFARQNKAKAQDVVSREKGALGQKVSGNLPSSALLMPRSLTNFVPFSPAIRQSIPLSTREEIINRMTSQMINAIFNGANGCSASESDASELEIGKGECDVAPVALLEERQSQIL